MKPGGGTAWRRACMAMVIPDQVYLSGCNILAVAMEGGGPSWNSLTKINKVGSVPPWACLATPLAGRWIAWLGPAHASSGLQCSLSCSEQKLQSTMREANGKGELVESVSCMCARFFNLVKLFLCSCDHICSTRHYSYGFYTVLRYSQACRAENKDFGLIGHLCASRFPAIVYCSFVPGQLTNLTGQKANLFGVCPMTACYFQLWSLL